MFLKLILATVCILTTTGLTEFEHLERIIGEDSGYDRRVRPNHGAGPVNIRISIFVLNIPEISFAKHSAEMTVEMYYRQLWHDPRLVDHHDQSQIIVGGRDIAERIWVPDTFFENEHSSESKETYLKIENGNIIWSQKMKLTFTKHGKDFYNFPFDTQNFVLKMESFRLLNDAMSYKWKDLELSPDISFHDFTLAEKSNKSNINRLGQQNKAYSQVEAGFRLVRDPSFYFSILFTPLTLITVLALIILISPINGKLILLLIINIFMILYKIWFRSTQLPPVSGSILACDFIDICLATTFCCLIQQVLMSSISTNKPRHNILRENINMDESPTETVNGAGGCSVLGFYLDTSRIDLMTKLCIPAIFITMQIFFWIKVAAI